MSAKNQSKKFPKVSIITPFYNEEEMVPQYFRELKNVFKDHLNNIEIVCVNDGSKDNTLSILQKFSAGLDAKIIDLSRNF